MSTTPRRVEGLGYLAAITELCHRIRLAEPTRFGWEAADFQWWWRQPRPTDHDGQLVFDDDAGVPCAAVVRTFNFRGHCELDVVVAPDAPREVEDAAWEVALDWVRSSTSQPIEAAVADEARVAALRNEGFVREAEGFDDAWMDAGAAPTVNELPSGFELFDRAHDATRPHHLIGRNGEGVAERLAQCSLYREDLDLFVVAPDGEVCAYGLFWPDPVTKVGLVEPMRTEDAYQHLGIASHVLATGLGRLAAAGCDRLKVSAVGPLYLRAGFVGTGSAALLSRRPRR